MAAAADGRVVVHPDVVVVVVVVGDSRDLVPASS